MASAELSRDEEAERPLEARCISVRAARAHYALDMSEVQEVIGMRPLTRVFHAPLAIAGVTSLRGDVLPVLDLAVLLGGDVTALSSPDVRIVVVRETAGLKRRAGLVVDGLAGLRTRPEGALVEAPATINKAARTLIVGVIPEPPPCSVLSVKAVFNAPELVAFSSVGEGDA